MVAIPELDGATGPMVFGGRSDAAEPTRARDMHAHAERAATLAARTARLVALRRSERARAARRDRAVQLPARTPATPARPPICRSSNRCYRTLGDAARSGYRVDVPASVEALRERIIKGNAELHGTHANVQRRSASIPMYAARPGCARSRPSGARRPGASTATAAPSTCSARSSATCSSACSRRRLRRRSDAAAVRAADLRRPTRSRAFYRWIREDFRAHAVLHFGTHGALEFMPGKQAGLSGKCWPDRLIGDLPNFYLYASNNPSEGAIAKRRSAATMISYLTPPVVQGRAVSRAART